MMVYGYINNVNTNLVPIKYGFKEFLIKQLGLVPLDLSHESTH